MYWVVHPLRPQDFPPPSGCPSGHLSGLGKSLGRRGCTTQYIPPLGSVRIQYCWFESSTPKYIKFWSNLQNCYSLFSVPLNPLQETPCLTIGQKAFQGSGKMTKLKRDHLTVFSNGFQSCSRFWVKSWHPWFVFARTGELKQNWTISSDTPHINRPHFPCSSRVPNNAVICCS